MNNFCEKCGFALNSGDRFCQNCGHKVSSMNQLNNNLNQNRDVVSNVFCYSKKIAKENGNKVTFLLPFVIFILYFIVLVILISAEKQDSVLSNILVLVFFVSIIYSFVLIYIRKRAKTVGFAVTSSGKIYRAAALISSGLYVNGVSINKFSNDFKDSTNLIGLLSGSPLSAIFLFTSLNQSAKYMGNPEILVTLVNNAKLVTGAKMMEITKVHSIKIGRHSIKIKCDYNFCNAKQSANQLVYNGTVRIEKSYENLDYLLKMLENHKNY